MKWEYGVLIQASDGTTFVFHGEEPMSKKVAKQYIVAGTDVLVRRRINKWKKLK